MSNPLFEFRFNSIIDNTIKSYEPKNPGTEIADNTIAGTVNGGCTIVDDPAMGKCMQFDGSTGYVSLPHFNYNFLGGFTLTAWVCFNACTSFSRIIDFGNGEYQNNIVLCNWDSSNTLSYGIARNNSLQINFNEDKAIKVDTWMHVAVTVDKDGKSALYLNGEETKNKTDANLLPESVHRTLNYIGRSNWSANSLFSGKMAWLSMFNTSLSPEQIVAEKNKALLMKGAYGRSFPVNFALESDNQSAKNPVIYLENSGASEEMLFTIENTSNSSFSISPLTSSSPTQSNYHFQLQFRPGVLVQKVLDQNQLTLNAPNTRDNDNSSWKLTAGRMSNGGIYLSFLFSGSTPVNIDTGHHYLFKISGIIADAVGGSRTTNVKFLYQNLQFTGTGTPSQGQRMQHLDIISHIGQKNIPLRADVMGTNTIVNNGSDANHLFIRITNTGTDDIKLRSGNLATSFVVTAQGQAQNTISEWALAEMDNLQNITCCMDVVAIAKPINKSKNISLRIPLAQTLPAGTNLKLISIPGNQTYTSTTSTLAEKGSSSIEVNTAQNITGSTLVIHQINQQRMWLPVSSDAATNRISWTIKNAQTKKLGAGESFILALQEIISGTKTGNSIITIDYKNIPGYWDGQLSVEVHKSPLIANDTRVGIGTNNPNSELDVKGVIQGVGMAPPYAIMMMTGNSIDKFNANGEGLINTPYQGWAICNGNNGTPDLRDRFIVGAGADAQKDTSGGPDTHSHQIDPNLGNFGTGNAGQHNHHAPNQWYARWIKAYDLNDDDRTNGKTGIDAGGQPKNEWLTTSDGEHSHTIHASQFLSGPSSGLNRPKYYALFFIMRLPSS